MPEDPFESTGFVAKVVEGNKVLLDALAQSGTPKELCAHLHRSVMDGVSIADLCAGLSLPSRDVNPVYLILGRLKYFLALRSRVVFESFGRENADVFIENNSLIGEVTTLSENELELVQTDFGRSLLQGFKETIADLVADLANIWRPTFSREFQNDSALKLAYQIWFWNSEIKLRAWEAITDRLASHIPKTGIG